MVELSPTMVYDEMLIHSFRDLRDDFDNLSYIANSALTLLKQFTKDINSSQKHIYPDTLIRIKTMTHNLRQLYEGYASELSRCKKQSIDSPVTLGFLQKLSHAKSTYFDLLRSQAGILGSLMTSTDWQSPSFLHSLISQAGRQTGKILGTINDYKRDTHLDALWFENRYKKEYIDAPYKFGIHVYITNSGQSAFATILNFLHMEGKVRERVVIGKSVYFQNKQLIRRYFDKRIVEVDEFQTDTIIQTIRNKQPSVIYFDSLCNAKSLPLPYLEYIIAYLVKHTVQDTYLLIDNTCLSIGFQPFKLIIGKTRKVHLILFESLMKYCQFGLDRVTSGIIAAYGKDTGKLAEYRKHTGTIITDSSIYALPTPDRKFLEKRLSRFQRNASHLASFLHEHVRTKRTCIIEKIMYPGLDHHPSFRWSSRLQFQGSFFTIEFRKGHEGIRRYKLFMNSVIDTARKSHVDIVAGTSFGFNTTRIYLTALHTKYGEPFMRVSVGTENAYQMDQLKKVFVKAIDNISDSILTRLRVL